MGGKQCWLPVSFQVGFRLGFQPAGGKEGPSATEKPSLLVGEMSSGNQGNHTCTEKTNHSAAHSIHQFLHKKKSLPLGCQCWLPVLTDNGGTYERYDSYFDE